MKCFNCKTELDENAKFCGCCGEAQGFSQEVIDRAAAGDEIAVTELYNKTYQNVYLTVKGMIRDEDTVLDICQDTYVKAFQSLEQLGNADSFRPWVKTIARNRAVDYLRKTKPVLFSELENEDGEMQEFVDERKEHLPEAAIDEQETARLLKEMLDSLPEDQRACISMFYYEDMPIKEIAATLGVSDNTVKSRLNYGKQKIKANVEALEKKGTKLYGLGGTPMLLLLLLFRKQGGPSAAAQLAQLGKVKVALESGAKAVAEATTQQTGQTIAEVGKVAKTGGQTIAKTGKAVQMTGQTLAKGAAVTAGKAAAVKVAAVIAAVAIVGGGAGAGVYVNRQRQLAAGEAVAEENVAEDVTEVGESTDPGETQPVIDPETEETGAYASAEEVLALLPEGEYVTEDGEREMQVRLEDGVVVAKTCNREIHGPDGSILWHVVRFTDAIIEENRVRQEELVFTANGDGSIEAPGLEKDGDGNTIRVAIDTDTMYTYYPGEMPKENETGTEAQAGGDLVVRDGNTIRVAPEILDFYDEGEIWVSADTDWILCYTRGEGRYGIDRESRFQMLLPKEKLQNPDYDYLFGEALDGKGLYQDHTFSENKLGGSFSIAEDSALSVGWRRGKDEDPEAKDVSERWYVDGMACDTSNPNGTLSPFEKYFSPIAGTYYVVDRNNGIAQITDG